MNLNSIPHPTASAHAHTHTHTVVLSFVSLLASVGNYRKHRTSACWARRRRCLVCPPSCSLSRSPLSLSISEATATTAKSCRSAHWCQNAQEESVPKGHFSAPLLTGRTVGNPRIRLTLDNIIIPLRLRKSGLRAKKRALISRLGRFRWAVQDCLFLFLFLTEKGQSKTLPACAHSASAKVADCFLKNTLWLPQSRCYFLWRRCGTFVDKLVFHPCCAPVRLFAFPSDKVKVATEEECDVAAGD